MSKRFAGRSEKTLWALCAAAGVFATALSPSYAADRTIDADYTLPGDETVDGVLTIAAGATLDLAGHKLTVAGLAGAGTVTSSVAAVYRRLEYLEGVGPAYINTGYVPVSATTADMRLRFTGNLPASNGSWKTVFGTRKNVSSGDKSTWFGVFLYRKNDGKVYFWRSLRGDQDQVVDALGVVETGVDYYLKLDKDGSSRINGREFGSGLAGDCAYPALLFTMNQNGDDSPGDRPGGGAGQRLYYCRFAEDGTTVRDFVPARRLADGVLGMYDRATGEFKTNAGEGEFAGGPERAERAFATGELHLAPAGGAGAWDCAQIKIAPDVAVVADGGALAADADWRALGTVFTSAGEALNLSGHALRVSGIDGQGTVTDGSGYEYLDYIQGSGSQYINTGYTMGSGTTADFKAQFLGAPSGSRWHGVFGQRAGGSDKVGACVFLFTTNGRTTFWKTLNGDANTSLAAAMNTDYTFHIDKTGTGPSTVTGGSFDNATLGTAIGGTCSGPAYIFNLNQGGNVWSVNDSAKMRLYHLTFSENGELVRNMIPARRITDSAIGLLDTIGNAFYANAGSGSFTAGSVTNVASSSTGGELHVDVPAGAECDNKDVTISGSLKFVKDGEGAFVASKSNQLYAGGTLVAAGELRATWCNVENNVSDSYFYGVAGGEVTVAEGAVMNFDGNGNHNTMKFVLAGGEIRNAREIGMAGHAWISDLRLTADSKISGHSFGFVHAGSAAMSVDLGGNTLTIDVTASKELYVANTTFTGGGKVVANTGGWIDIGYYNKPCTFADGVTLDVRGAALNVLQPTAVSGTYESDCLQTWDGGSGVMQVSGRFKPNTALYHSTLMKNGSTLDLGGLTSVLADTCYFSASKVHGSLAFEQDATITVALGERTPQLYEKLLAWPVRPEGVTFQFDEATAAGGVPVVVASDGIYYGADPESRVVDRAWWTGAAGDGNVANAANWACTNAAGRVVADALPGSLADVRVTGDVAMQIPQGITLEFHTLDLDGAKLSADCDWRGLGAANAFNGTLNLNGKRLRVSGLGGFGTITDASKGYLTLDYIQGSGSQYINTGYTMNSGSTADFKAQFLGAPANSSWHGVFGQRVTVSDKAGACVFLYTTGGRTTFWRTLNGDANTSHAAAMNTDYTFHIDKTGAASTVTGGSLDNAVLGTATTTACSGEAYIFNLNQGGSVWAATASAKMRLYHLTFSENGELVRDFVPAMRPSDGAVGLYERIGGQFYGNDGDGEFIAGSVKDDLAGTGELIVDVPEGQTLTASTVRITGGVKLVKSGPGTYVSTITQTYLGGTLVAEGKAQPHDAPNDNDITYCCDRTKAFGPGVIDVAEGAVFDLRANYAYYGVRSDTGLLIRLDGGTLANSGPHDMGKTSNGGSGLGALAADSHLDVTRSLMFQSNPCDLGGNTLFVNIASGKSWHIRETSFANGRVETGTTGWLHIVSATDASTVDFKVNSALQIDAQFDVGGYEPVWEDATTHKGTAAMNVHGVFKPAAHDYFYGCTLLDGATIDFANRSTPLPMVSAFTDTGKKNLEFAENATIKVRKGARCGKVVEWTDETKPASFDTLTFVRDPADQRSYLVQKRDDGIYITSGGISIILR